MKVMTRSIAWCALVGVSTLALSSAAWAQVADDGADAKVADIVVTAQKRSERLNDVPMAITAASGEELQSRGVNSVEDLVKLVPGFQATQTTLNPVYTLRGVGFFDTTLAARGAVAVYNDEVGLPFGVMTQGIPFDLERVEVLKGPQGTLYGQNSTGGAINYISAKPTDQFKAGISGEFGRFSRGFVEAFASGPLTDTLKARIAVHQDFGGDWQKGFTNDQTSGKRNAIAGRILLDWRPTDRLRVNTNFTITHIDSDPQMPQVSSFWANIGGATRPAELVGYPLPPRSNRAADFTPGQSYYKRDQLLMGAVRIDYDLTDKWQVTSLTSYQDYSRSNRNERDGTTVYNNSFMNEGSLKVFQQELRVSGEIGDRARILVGLNYEHDKAFQMDSSDFTQGSVVRAYYSVLPNVPFNGGTSRTNSRYTSKAAFGNFEFNITPTLKAQAGVRYTEYSGKGNNCNFDAHGTANQALTIIYNLQRAARGLPPIPPLGPTDCLAVDGATFTPHQLDASLNENNTSWKVGLDWKAAPDLLLYGNVSKGYKGGSFQSFPALVDVQFNPARQESLLDYELGFKLGLFNRTLQLNGAAFYYDYRDKQIQGRIITSVGSQPTLVNVPKSRLKGAELEARWTPNRHFRFSGGITYLDSRVRSSFVNFEPQGRSVNYQGESFPFTAKWQGSADAEVRGDLRPDLEIFAGASVQAQTKSTAAFGLNPNFNIDGYATLDLRIGIEKPDAGWRVSLFGRNVTNTYYWNSTIRGLDTNVRYTGMPTTYGIAFSYRP